MGYQLGRISTHVCSEFDAVQADVCSDHLAALKQEANVTLAHQDLTNALHG